MGEHRLLYTKIAETLDDVVRQIDAPTTKGLPTVFRGQANSDWLVQSSFSRWYNRRYPKSEEAKFIDDIRQIEKIAGDGFGARRHSHDLALALLEGFHQEIGDIEGLNKNFQLIAFLAQHYGIPTNLLDFTFDPYRALFFAFNYEHEPETEYVSLFKTTPWHYAQALISGITKHHFIEDVELWREIASVFETDCGLKIPEIWAVDFAINIRLQAQAGCFVYFPECFPYDKIMHQLECWQPNGGWGSQMKLDIPISLKGEVLELLITKGITKDEIYPKSEFSGLPDDAIELDSHLNECAKKILKRIG